MCKGSGGHKKVKFFSRLATRSFSIIRNSHLNRAIHQIRASTMKTSLIVCLSSLALALTSLAQSPAAPQASPRGAPAMSPAAGALVNPAAPAQLPPGASAPPAGAPAPEATVTATLSPAPTAAESPSPAAEAKPTGGVRGSNWLIDKFHKGGPIMWPILIVSIIGLTVVIERIFWWNGRWFRRDNKRC